MSNFDCSSINGDVRNFLKHRRELNGRFFEFHSDMKNLSSNGFVLGDSSLKLTCVGELDQRCLCFSVEFDGFSFIFSCEYALRDGRPCGVVSVFKRLNHDVSISEFLYSFHFDQMGNVNLMYGSGGMPLENAQTSFAAISALKLAIFSALSKKGAEYDKYLVGLPS